MKKVINNLNSIPMTLNNLVGYTFYQDLKRKVLKEGFKNL